MNYRYGIGELRDGNGFPILDEKKKPIKGHMKLLLPVNLFSCHICENEVNKGFSKNRNVIFEGEELKRLTAQSWDEWKNLLKWLKFRQSKEFFTKPQWRMMGDGYLYCDDCLSKTNQEKQENNHIDLEFHRVTEGGNLPIKRE